MCAKAGQGTSVGAPVLVQSTSLGVPLLVQDTVLPTVTCPNSCPGPVIPASDKWDNAYSGYRFAANGRCTDAQAGHAIS